MRQFHVLLVSDTGTTTCDGLEYKGKLWLVPKWLDYPQERMSKPARLIRFDCFPLIEMPPGLHEYAVDRPIPKSVLDGESSEGFEILEGDQITFGIRREPPERVGH